MAAMTPQSIRERLHELLQADEPGLIPSQEVFSLLKQPNSLVDKAYTLTAAREREDSQTANVTARIDRVTLTVAKKFNMDAEASVQTLQDWMDDIDRRVRQDGVSQGYHAWPLVNRIERPEGQDYCLGELSWRVDYDFSEAVA